MNARTRILLLVGITFLLSGEYAELKQEYKAVCTGPCCLECLRNKSLHAINVDKETTWKRQAEVVYGCGKRECVLDSNAKYAIDNDLSTSWNSSATYDSSNKPVLMGLTLNLGQVTILLYNFILCRFYLCL